MATKARKVAIVHDWLYGGGAEQVVLQLHKLYPDAPIYTSYCSDEWRKKLDDKVVTGYLQKWPFNVLRKFVPFLRQRWFSHLDLSGYDLVISSSGNGEAKGVNVAEDATHIWYCHSPTHFYWRHYDAYMKRPGFGIFNPLARLGLRILVGPLRRWDYKASQKADYIIANSTHIQHDIKEFYGRESVVIYPPVDVDRFAGTKHKTPRYGFVTLGRQQPYKRNDVIVQACSELGLPLTVIGRGPEHQKLVTMAGSTVRFLTNADDTTVARELAKAQGFLFAAFEDFGISPVEALAAGTPVVAYNAGGAQDYVVPGKTGVFFDEQNAASLAEALKGFSEQKFNHAAIAKHAQQFSDQAFRTQIAAYIKKVAK